MGVWPYLGEMLYPLLSIGTSFPLGSPSENMDSLLMNGSIRVRRAVSEVGPSILGQRAGRPRQWTPSYRPDREIKYNSYTDTATMNRPVTALWGKSSSFIGRSKYLPTTPKYRTEYPRFHTGFCFVPMSLHK